MNQYKIIVLNEKKHTRRTLCTSSVHKHTSSHSLAHYDFEQEKIVHNKRINVAFLASFFKKEKEGEREKATAIHRVYAIFLRSHTFVSS